MRLFDSATVDKDRAGLEFPNGDGVGATGIWSLPTYEGGASTAHTQVPNLPSQRI